MDLLLLGKSQGEVQYNLLDLVLPLSNLAVLDCKKGNRERGEREGRKRGEKERREREERKRGEKEKRKRGEKEKREREERKSLR